MKLEYIGPAQVAFPPVTVLETTTTGQEAWRTAIRIPPAYGIFGVASRPIAPTGLGARQLERLNLMQPANPHLAYLLGSPADEGGQD